MSKERRIIEIAPWRMSPGGRMTERIDSLGHNCPYCQGNGYLWQEDEWQERYKKECPICKGSGRLDAVITVEWKAATSPDPSEGGGCLAGTFSEGGGQ